MQQWTVTIEILYYYSLYKKLLTITCTGLQFYYIEYKQKAELMPSTSADSVYL